MFVEPGLIAISDDEVRRPALGAVRANLDGRTQYELND
jgi:hypothetical protein